jgi:hypothetical protein
MTLSLEEALALLNKWKHESALLFILGQHSFRWGLRAVQEGGVDWTMALRAKVSQVSGSEGTATVVFEGAGGDLSVAMDACAFSYDQNCEGPTFLREEGSIRAHSRLFIFLASDEAFVIYELEEGKRV